jgi:hypothetical protein
MESADHTPFALPSPLRDFLCIVETSAGGFFVRDLFRRKFGHVPPDFGHHIVIFYRTSGPAFHVASYLHLWTTGSIGLIGGGCTDGRTMRLMSDDERRAVVDAGGLLLQTLRYTFDRFGPGLDAFFGHCGDARALAVDLEAGFQRTDDPNLLVRWNAALDAARRESLFQQAIALGAF